MQNKEGDFGVLLKIFLNWTKYKFFLHINSKKEIYFYEGQIWWVALGRNIGYEMDGKNREFNRPVIILKKYSSSMCLVVPLTTKVKDNSPYYQFEFFVNGKRNAANLTQARSISTKRLLQKETALSNKKFKEIKRAFIRLLEK
jgi:mRNA interferase MazF